MVKSFPKIRILCYLSLNFFLFSIPAFLKASECQIIFNENNTSSMKDSKIKKEISSFFINHCLSPVLTNKEIKYEITKVFEDSNAIYTIGILSQETNCFYALFSFQTNWFRTRTTTQLLYMATDIPPSPLLFRDICSFAQFFLPKSPSNYHVLIQKFANSLNKVNKQLWTFYNTDEWIEFIVTLVPTPDGGTDFMLSLVK